VCLLKTGMRPVEYFANTFATPPRDVLSLGCGLKTFAQIRMPCWRQSRRPRPKPDGANLRCFLGMAAGVGKTYAMLQAAQRAQREGTRRVRRITLRHTGVKRLTPFWRFAPERTAQRPSIEGLRWRKWTWTPCWRARPNWPWWTSWPYQHSWVAPAKRYQDVIEIARRRD